MNFHQFKNALFFFALTSFTVVNAQQKTIEIKGKVIETETKQTIEYATISIIDNVTKKPITGTITNEAGLFSIDVTSGNFYIEVSFLGFISKTFKDFKVEKNKIDLKTISLSEDLEALGEVLVRAQKSQTEFKLDKRVFNVGSDLSATGAGALEVLNNVPSVNVSIEGEVSLRGNSGVQILINGKPSVLASADGNALGTITADMIEKIEVITNPSAKYDAAGTSGIINIVIKKSEKKGLNGSVSLNVGVPNSNSFGLSLNRRTEKFNLFSQLGFGLRTYPGETESINEDFEEETTVQSFGDSEFDEKFSNFLLGTDYHINDRNVITLTGSYAYEVEDQSSQQDFTSIDGTNSVTDAWLRDEKTEATNPKLSYELQYKKDFKRHEDQSLLFSALGSSFRKDQSSYFENTTSIGSKSDAEQITRTDYKLADYTFKLDYVHPFLEKYTIETGSQYVINEVSNDFAVSDLDDDVWVSNPNLTNIFNFDQNVLGVYTTASYEGEKWGVKLGVRMEDTQIETLLETTNENHSKNYTDLFPSAHTSYKVNDDFSIQAGYSRRINRPNLRSLNPFSNIRNTFSISTGNPDLEPEYTNSYEITSIHKIGKASLNFSLYNRYTTDVIESVIVSFEEGVSTSRPENIGTSNTTGLEFNGKYNPLNWFSLSGEFNINFFDRNGIFESESFNFKGNRWSSSLTSKFKLPLDFDLEVSGDYQSEFESLQGRIYDNLYADLGLRKKILKGKVILNMSIRDVFASRVNQSETIQPDYYLYNSRKRGRFVTFGVSYGFGKGEAMEFSGQRRR
ncbi:TonB-dependent receptor domain-containing protein [Algibacter miyuki]|uniref:TonB-dependent receptor domain-containing protein n=1 Tax=Algibacter miyuki TaxID=1306933 RepID=A0ABV5GXU5_9FLAO|nr:TonB-dependent receptor [Algibacter miyuki]MDN3667323.1 TonB-dependent receptor [Algibacter miyuki]